MPKKGASDKSNQCTNISIKLYPSLSRLEMSFYIASWAIGIFIAFQSIYFASQDEALRLKKVNMVRPWWRFWSSILMRRDISDQEWETWKRAAVQVGPLVILFPIISTFFKRYFKDFALLFSAIYSVVVTIYLLGLFPTMFLFLQIVVIWAAYHTNSSKVVWAVAITYIICLEIYPLKTLKDSLFMDTNGRHFQGPLTMMILLFMNLCCVSFSLDRIWNRVERETRSNSFLMLTAFCFYLPLLVCGAQITSKTFKEGFGKPSPKMDKSFWVNILIQSLRYLLWFIVTDVSLYFMYQQAFRLQPNLVMPLDLWSLCGMGYSMIMLFQLKLTVMYGLTGFIASLDNISAPPHPKCIARFHLFSETWRNVDNGFYTFVKEYVYLPSEASLPNSKMSRLLASAVAYIFMFIWHGGGMVFSVFIWCSGNFLCATCEDLARTLASNIAYQQMEKHYLGLLGVRRLHALLASPLLLMGLLTGLFFFSNEKVGYIFVRRILFESWPWGLPTIIFFLYCCSQVSIELKNFKIKRQMKEAKAKKE